MGCSDDLLEQSVKAAIALLASHLPDTCIYPDFIGFQVFRDSLVLHISHARLCATVIHCNQGLGPSNGVTGALQSFKRILVCPN